MSTQKAGYYDPIGTEKRGVVAAISKDLGFGYVAEDGTMSRFAFSIETAEEEYFDSLEIGTRVAFFENGHSCVAYFVK